MYVNCIIISSKGVVGICPFNGFILVVLLGALVDVWDTVSRESQGGCCKRALQLPGVTTWLVVTVERSKKRLTRRWSDVLNPVATLVPPSISTPEIQLFLLFEKAKIYNHTQSLMISIRKWDFFS